LALAGTAFTPIVAAAALVHWSLSVVFHLFLCRSSLMAPFELPETGLDRAIATTAAGRSSITQQKIGRAVSFVGEEKALLAIAGAMWLGSRRLPAERRVLPNHLLTSLIATTFVSHLLKKMIDQPRPDRVMVGEDRQGVERSGKPKDAFPSGHSIHAAAIATVISQAYPTAKWIVWPLAGCVMSARIAVLAHWPTDVVAGATLGIGIAKITGRLADESQAR
jgi:membrane-associated phospholipid phosphatase